MLRVKIEQTDNNSHVVDPLMLLYDSQFTLNTSLRLQHLIVAIADGPKFRRLMNIVIALR